MGAQPKLHPLRGRLEECVLLSGRSGRRTAHAAASVSPAVPQAKSGSIAKYVADPDIHRCPDNDAISRKMTLVIGSGSL